MALKTSSIILQFITSREKMPAQSFSVSDRQQRIKQQSVYSHNPKTSPNKSLQPSPSTSPTFSHASTLTPIAETTENGKSVTAPDMMISTQGNPAHASQCRIIVTITTHHADSHNSVENLMMIIPKTEYIYTVGNLYPFSSSFDYLMHQLISNSDSKLNVLA